MSNSDKLISSHKDLQKWSEGNPLLAAHYTIEHQDSMGFTARVTAAGNTQELRFDYPFNVAALGEQLLKAAYGGDYVTKILEERIQQVMAVGLPTQKQGDVQWIAEAADAAHAKMPDGYAVVVFGVPTGGAGGNRLRYCANLPRPIVLQVMKEWLYHNGVSENWMQHVK